MTIKLGKGKAPAFKERHSWPFKGMQRIGAWLEVEDKDAWRETCKSAYAFASKKGWKFRCGWDEKASRGIIQRVS